MVGLGKDIGAIPEITSEIDHTTEAKVGIEIGLAVEREGQRFRTESRDRNRESRSITRSRSSSHVNTNRDRLRCYTCSEYDHFVGECPNALTDEESDSGSEDLDDFNWQMLSQVETSSFQDFDMQDLNM